MQISEQLIGLIYAAVVVLITFFSIKVFAAKLEKFVPDPNKYPEHIKTKIGHIGLLSFFVVAPSLFVVINSLMPWKVFVAAHEKFELVIYFFFVFAVLYVAILSRSVLNAAKRLAMLSRTGK